MRHIITLSTIPPRFASIAPALNSLLAQTSRPEAIELYIPRTYRRFPQWGGGLPDVPEGVTIVRVDEDLGPATKILPAAKARRGQDINLIYVDDDRVFGKTWVEQCLAQRRAHPGAAICGAGFSLKERYGYSFADDPLPRAVFAPDPRLQLRVQISRLLRAVPLSGKGTKDLKAAVRRFDQSGHVDIAEGYGGVMVRPEFFDDGSFDIPPVVWAVDDIWLSGCLTRQGIPIWADKDLWSVREVIDTSLHHPLFKAVIDGASRHEANRACVDYMRQTYGIWGGEAVQRT